MPHFFQFPTDVQHRVIQHFFIEISQKFQGFQISTQEAVQLLNLTITSVFLKYLCRKIQLPLIAAIETLYWWFYKKPMVLL